MAETSDDESVVVLSFASSYESVASRLTSLGLHQAATMSWSRGPNPDEAEWRGEGMDVRFETDFKTGLKILRVLRASGNPPANWAEGLDLMDHGEAQRLIGSGNKTEAIAGLLATQHIAASELLDAVRGRLLDKDDDISGEAAIALSRIARQERRKAEREGTFYE